MCSIMFTRTLEFVGCETTMYVNLIYMFCSCLLLVKIKHFLFTDNEGKVDFHFAPHYQQTFLGGWGQSDKL